MRVSIIFILLIAIFSSCGEPKKELSYQDKLNELRKNEVSKNIRNDEIFLGFRFGMSEGEVYRHFKELLKDNKIYADENLDYTYDFKIENEALPLKIIFRPEYISNKLYKLTLICSPLDKLIETINPFDLDKLYTKKFGPNDLYTYDKEKEELHIIWIDGNREIEIENYKFRIQRIIYSDNSVYPYGSPDSLKARKLRETEKRIVNDL